MATRGVRGIRGARKMPSLRKPVVHALRTPGEWNALLESTPGLLLVEFTAPWSAPCKAMAPYLPLLAAQPEYAAVVFARVDVDASPELGARLGVQHAPTYHFYRDGVMLEHFSGALPPKLVELLAKYKVAEGGRKGGRRLLAFAAAALAVVFYLMRTASGAGGKARREEAAAAPPPPPPPPEPVKPAPRASPRKRAGRRRAAAAAAAPR